MPKVSYIVSVYDRLDHLKCCIASLGCQTDRDFEVIVVLTHPAINYVLEVSTILQNNLPDVIRSQVVNTITHDAHSTYHASNYGSGYAKGEFLCFPSDDSYYVPIFQEEHVRAAETNGWDFVYADQLYDRRQGDGKYSPMITQMQCCHIDKTGFLIRRRVFEELNGFEGLDENSQLGTADGFFAEKCRDRGVPNGKIHEVFSVHN